MKHSWSILALLAAACAAPPARAPEIRIRVVPSDPGAFHVADADREPETRRYRIKPEEVLPAVSESGLDGCPSGG